MLATVIKPEPEIKKKKRIRYAIPTYKKVYSVYQYDRLKFARIYKQIRKEALNGKPEIFFNSNPYDVLRKCYIRDENNKLMYLGDEKHIFRYKVLENVLKEIADYLIIGYELLPQEDVLLYLFRKTHLILYEADNDERQAELLETIRKPINIRLKTHIKLLRLLQKGLEIEEAVKYSISNLYNK